MLFFFLCLCIVLFLKQHESLDRKRVVGRVIIGQSSYTMTQCVCMFSETRNGCFPCKVIVSWPIARLCVCVCVLLFVFVFVCM